MRIDKGATYDSVINIVNEFLPVNKVIVYIEGKSFHRRISVFNGNGILQKRQIIILIDKMSASASEIIAGSLQSNDRVLGM